MADLTPLEQQIMKDYGQYITVPTGAADRSNRKLAPFNSLAYLMRGSPETPAQTRILPTGISYENNQYRITPQNDLFQKYASQLAGDDAKLVGRNFRNELFSEIANANRTAFKFDPLAYRRKWKQPQSNINSSYGFLDFMRHANPLQPMNRTNFGAWNPRPAPAPVLTTNTLDQAMQAYANKNNMTLDQLQAKINNSRTIQSNTPQSIEDINRLMYAAPEANLSQLEAKYAQGGRVRTHYAEGDLVETAPQMLSANPELNALLQSYNTGADYSKQLEQARQQRSASEADFNKSMENLVSSTDSGPSKAELYWKLAAAFGAPAGKTGQFGENLASAAGTMAEHGKEQRAAESARRKLTADIGLKRQEMALESAKDTEKTLLGLQSEANKDRREMIKASVKEYIDSGKPQSEAGRIAKDKGLTVGSPEYQAEVDKQANLLIEKQLGAIKAQMLSSQATIAGLGVQQAKEAREAVKLEPDERKAIRDDEDAIHAAKSTMTNIDEAIGMVDKAFSNTIPDKALYRKLKQTNPQDPRVIATEQLENLLGTNVLGSLKATFGGNPTEGERAALRDLQGLSGATPESRKKMLERAKKALAEGAEHRSMRINKIETGGYRKKTTE